MFLHDLETGRGRRVAVLLAAFFGVAIVIWAVAMGFHGRHYNRSARALAPWSVPGRSAP